MGTVFLLMLMEWKFLTEQNEQGLEEKTVQTSGKEAEKPKKRSQSDKIGRHKWNQQLLKSTLQGIEDLKTELRWVRHKLDRLGEADYSKEDIEHFAVLDAVDREIMQRLLEVGAGGALPKDVAAEVNRRGEYGLKYYEVSRRLVRLNKKLHNETGKVLFEKRGHKWALTKFAFDVYGVTESEADNSNSVVKLEEDEQ
jgi:hypothetical protein